MGFKVRPYELAVRAGKWSLKAGGLRQLRRSRTILRTCQIDPERKFTSGYMPGTRSALSLGDLVGGEAAIGTLWLRKNSNETAMQRCRSHSALSNPERTAIK